MNTMLSVGTIFECPECQNTVVVTGNVKSIACRCRAAQEEVELYQSNRPLGIPFTGKRTVPYGAVKEAALTMLRRRKVVTSVDIVEEFTNLKPASVSCALHHLREEGVIKPVKRVENRAIAYRLIRK